MEVNERLQKEGERWHGLTLQENKKDGGKRKQRDHVDDNRPREVLDRQERC